MRKWRGWKWIVWQEWPHTLALLLIWYIEQWKEYYSHVKLLELGTIKNALHSSSFVNSFLSCHIYSSIFIAFFSPSSLLLCEIESQLPDLTVQRSIPLAQSDSLFPPFPSSFPFCEAPQTAGPAPHSSVIQHLQTEQHWAWSSPHSTQPASSRKGLTARKCRPAATRPLWWQGEGNWGLSGAQIGICSTLVSWARVHS